jgi:hypothetical protein
MRCGDPRALPAILCSQTRSGGRRSIGDQSPSRERMKMLREEGKATHTDLVIFRMLFGDYQKYQAEQIKNRTN